jgi:hypothetical protein
MAVSAQLEAHPKAVHLRYVILWHSVYLTAIQTLLRAVKEDAPFIKRKIKRMQPARFFKGTWI